MKAAIGARKQAGLGQTGHVVWRRLREHRGHYLRRIVEAVVKGYEDNDLLTYASAISFQVFFAFIPFLLFLLGLVSVLNLNGVWEHELSGRVSSHLSHAAFTVVDQTVERILHSRSLFWVTFGPALAVWEISGATRAIMGVFNRMYGVEHERGFWHRMVVSIALAIGAMVLALLALAVVQFVPIVTGHHGGLVGVLAFILRWGVALGLLVALVAMLVRFAPADHQPISWVSFGALLSVFAWFVASLIFGWYLTHIADYRSIFGNLATVIVLMEYLYISATVFLTGIQIDALARNELHGEATGHLPAGRSSPSEGDGVAGPQAARSSM